MNDMSLNLCGNNTIVIANSLFKIYSKMKEIKSQEKNKDKEKIFDFLLEQCNSKNSQVSLLSCQLLVKLVEDGVMESGRILSSFISMLPNASLNQFTAISEGIISLLLLDLKRKSDLNRGKECEYRCPFEMYPPQHPIIMMLQSNDSHMNDLVNKMNGICNHHDRSIRQYSIEFLRPVFLYVLCNSNKLPDSKTMWTCLLIQTETSPDALNLMYEILAWSRTSSPSSCLFISILLAEALEFYLTKQKYQIVADLTIYLSVIIFHLIKYSYDPRPSLNLILKILHKEDCDELIALNLLLLSLARSMHIISPIYVTDITRILKHLVSDKNAGSFVTLHIILDAVIQWIAHPSFVPQLVFNDFKFLIDFIKNECYAQRKQTAKATILTNNDIYYFDPELAFWANVCVFTETLETGINSSNFTILEQFITTLNSFKNTEFADIINLVIRALILSNKLPYSLWLNLLKLLLKIVETNQNVAVSFLMPILYKLTNELHPETQLELLRSLPMFAVVKENVPIILNTIKLFSTGPISTVCLDLYLRLWKTETRTYPFLFKMLSEIKSEDKWELCVTKAATIKEICILKPSQHVSDLVVHLSNILNESADSDGTATSLVIESISILCESHSVNVVSTWKALSFKFQYEKRENVIQSLCKFFAQVPLLKSPTLEYEKLVEEIVEKLWIYILTSENKIVIASALDALKNYSPDMLTLKQIPEIFRQKLKITSNLIKTPIDSAKDPVEVMSFIPGECWMQLIEKINPIAIEEAADLVAHHIGNEIAEFRSGIYSLPEGRPEPPKLALPAKSILGAVVNYIVREANNKSSETDLILTNSMRAISKNFAKPIPPLNWCFLHDLFHRNNELRKYSILIATNQVLCSGTAQRFICNYLNDFNPNQDNGTEEMLLAFGVLLKLMNGVAPFIIHPYVEKCLNYGYNTSKAKDFPAGCLFEQLLEKIEQILNDCTGDSINQFFSETIEKYFDEIDFSQKIFETYKRTLCALPYHMVESMTSPNTWWEISIPKLKKATLIRCFLAQHDKSNSSNPLNWFNAIINAAAENEIEQTFILKNVGETFLVFNNNKNACDWILELLGQIQTVVAEENPLKHRKSLFLCDIFTISINVLSRLSCLTNSFENLIISRQNRLDILPQSLNILCQKDYWNQHEEKIYEFLYIMFTNDEFSENITTAFKRSILLSKNRSYFDAKSIWTKYVGSRNNQNNQL